jgi:deazaflavin-dependent oxidoreductase (nitroreductase family)
MTNDKSATARPAFFDSALMSPALKIASRIHVTLYRTTGGRIGGTFRVGSAFPKGVPVCLLTTKGRKSGELRTVPLIFLRDGDRVVLVASRGGTPQHPQWYHNLRVEEQVLVRVGPRLQAMRARTATGEERVALWKRVTEMYPEYADYQAWTNREIPVVVCAPLDQE